MELPTEPDFSLSQNKGKRAPLLARRREMTNWGGKIPGSGYSRFKRRKNPAFLKPLVHNPGLDTGYDQVYLES